MDDRAPDSWLTHEDEAARSDRIRRLEWLAASYPVSDCGFIMHGGWLAHRLFEKARYCFAYGQDLAAVVLGVAFVERILAARAYGSGRDDLERASVSKLLLQARDSGWLAQEEYRTLHAVRQLRNPVAHFRRPLAADTPEGRALAMDSHPNEITEMDAQLVLTALFRLLARLAV